MPNGVVVATEEGVPQGGPLSPLLSNIVLDELDRELERRGHRFVRYADDCNVYVRSERSGQRVMASLVSFIERRLRLKVNKDKSAVARPGQRHFVGFSLRCEPLDGSVEVLLSERSRLQIRAKIWELTPRSWGQSLSDCIDGLNRYLLGWVGFFFLCTDAEERTMQSLDAHIRRRLRAIVLRHCKRRRHIVSCHELRGVHRAVHAERALPPRRHRPRGASGPGGAAPGPCRRRALPLSSGRQDPLPHGDRGSSPLSAGERSLHAIICCS
jgi:RNA-directed DNA polymerase